MICFCSNCSLFKNPASWDFPVPDFLLLGILKKFLQNVIFPVFPLVL